MKNSVTNRRCLSFTTHAIVETKWSAMKHKIMPETDCSMFGKIHLYIYLRRSWKKTQKSACRFRGHNWGLFCFAESPIQLLLSFVLFKQKPNFKMACCRWGGEFILIVLKENFKSEFFVHGWNYIKNVHEFIV